MFLTEWLETFFLSVSSSLAAAKASLSSFEELANFILSEGSVEILYLVVWFSLVIYGEIKRIIWF